MPKPHVTRLLASAFSLGCLAACSQPSPKTSATARPAATAQLNAPKPLFGAGARPRIMIVGDSISAGPGCYKGALSKNLRDNGYTRLEFVGRYTDDCGAGVRHSALSCATAEQYSEARFRMPNCRQHESFPGLAPLVAAHQPDLILLQLGVNDVWKGRSVEEILASYTRLTKQAREQNPRIALLVAQINKVQPNCRDTSVLERAERLVAAVPHWAASVSTEDSPVRVADLWTQSDWSMAETRDCVHPNEVGAQRMGRNWYEALAPLLTPTPG